MRKENIFFIDPMSYGTIAQYDRMLLNGIISSINESIDIEYNIQYFCSILLPFEYSNPVFAKRIFFYNKLSLSLLKGLSYIISYFVILLFTLLLCPKAIHIQWIRMPKLDLLFLRICKLINCKTIHTAHNILPHNNDKESIAKTYKKYYQEVDKIIVHSESTKLKLINDFNISPNKIYVVFHGLLPMIVSSFGVERELQQIESKIEHKNKIVISCLGVQSKYKGTDLIVKAWQYNKFLNQNENVILIIAGRSQGIDYDSIRRCSNVIIEDEFISNERYMAYLKVSSFTLLPYRDISQSGSLLTALGEKIPVMVSDVGGLTDPLRIADVGWSIGIPNEDNLSNSIINVLNNPNELYRKKNNREEWNKLFKALSWDEIGERTFKIYKEV